MSFDHHVAAEPQYFAHQSTVLITVDDDHSVNALIDGHNDEPKIRDALHCLSPVPAQRRLPTNNARRLRQNRRGYRRGKQHIVVKLRKDCLHIVSIPCFDPLLTERDRIKVHQGTVTATLPAAQRLFVAVDVGWPCSGSPRPSCD